MEKQNEVATLQCQSIHDLRLGDGRYASKRDDGNWYAHEGAGLIANSSESIRKSR